MYEYDMDSVGADLQRANISSGAENGPDMRSNISTHSDNSQGSMSSGNDAQITNEIGSARRSSVTSQDENEDNHDMETPPSTEVAESQKVSKGKNPFRFLKRMSSKSKNKSKAEKPKLSKFDQILVDVKVESLPQVFVTKYLGYKPCEGLWGIKNTRAPVEEMIEEVSSLDPERGEDLPLAQLKISLNGIHVKEHSANQCKSKHIDKGTIPIEFISYGVQDVRYTRVFSFILVREMSSKTRKLECHAYVCDSTASCRRLSLSVAMAFQEYSKSLEGKPFKFQVDLRPSDEIEHDLEPQVEDEEDTEDFEV